MELELCEWMRLVGPTRLAFCVCDSPQGDDEKNFRNDIIIFLTQTNLFAYHKGFKTIEQLMLMHWEEELKTWYHSIGVNVNVWTTLDALVRRSCSGLLLRSSCGGRGRGSHSRNTCSAHAHAHTYHIHTYIFTAVNMGWEIRAQGRPMYFIGGFVSFFMLFYTRFKSILVLPLTHGFIFWVLAAKIICQIFASHFLSFTDFFQQFSCKYGIHHKYVYP